MYVENILLNASQARMGGKKGLEKVSAGQKRRGRKETKELA